MLVQRILDFINRLSAVKPLISSDNTLLGALHARFKERRGDDHINASDIDFLRSCFKERFHAVLDTASDYTFNNTPANLLWIELGKDLGTEIKVNYLYIILPSITNEYDPNNETKLTDTNNFENFFLGNKGKTLYRKIALCLHLLGNDLTLSLCREPKGLLSALTVDELTRLKASHQQFRLQAGSTPGSSEEQFENFWSFLNIKVFPNLQRPYGRMPIEVLPAFLHLIESYFQYKASGTDFNQFKILKGAFFDRLSRESLKNINFFYGMKIRYNGGVHYLIELLISINSSNCYEMDDLFKAIAYALFKYHSALKTLTPELQDLYIDPPKNNADVFSSTEKHCLKLLISLLTTHFDSAVFSTRASISLWDKKNAIPSDTAEIAKFVIPFLEHNQIKELFAQYPDAYKRFSDAIGGTGKRAHFFQPHTTTLWHAAVDENNFSQLDVYWFEPEILLYRLMQIKISHPETSESIHTFLNGLINTYAQDKPEMLKRVRINILFSDFMKNLNPTLKRDLLVLLELGHLENARKNFLINCNDYIRDRLTDMTIREKVPSSNFFCEQRASELTVQPVLDGVKSVTSLIDAYKKVLSTSSPEYNSALHIKMLNYFITLGEPILSAKEEAEAQKSAQSSLDYYIGAPT